MISFISLILVYSQLATVSDHLCKSKTTYWVQMFMKHADKYHMVGLAAVCGDCWEQEIISVLRKSWRDLLLRSFAILLCFVFYIFLGRSTSWRASGGLGGWSWSPQVSLHPQQAPMEDTGMLLLHWAAWEKVLEDRSRERSSWSLLFLVLPFFRLRGRSLFLSRDVGSPLLLQPFVAVVN